MIKYWCIEITFILTDNIVYLGFDKLRVAYIPYQKTNHITQPENDLCDECIFERSSGFCDKLNDKYCAILCKALTLW